MDPLSSYKLIKDLRSGGEGKAILYERDGVKYVGKKRVFDNLKDANQGLKEAMSLARIIHPNTVRFEDAIMSQIGEQIEITIMMEFCEMGDLLDFLIDLSEPHHNNNNNHHTVTLGSELSTLNLGSEYTGSDIDSTSRSSSSSSLSLEPTLLTENNINNSIQHSHSSSSLANGSSSPPTAPTPLGSINNRHSISTPTIIGATTATIASQSSPQRKSSKSERKKKCSLKERKCIVKMTVDLTKKIFKKEVHSTNTTANNSSSLHMEEHVIDSNEIKKSTDSVYLIEQTQLVEWLLDLSYGVQALHKANMIHRDLKSENIFISGSNKLKIGDFGLAIQSAHHTGSVHSETVGTYCYSSPELLNSTYDKTTDIFSLGCIFYELITLRLLSHNRIFLGEDMLNNRFDSMQFLSTFPEKYEKLAPLVLSMISKNPTFRPSIESIIETLQKMDTSLLKERVVIKRENTIKGIRKQLDKSHFQEASLLLATCFVKDPRFNNIFPPSDPHSIPHLQHLYKYVLKVLSSYHCSIWGYFAIDGTMVSVFVWLNPEKKKEIRLSDCIKGSLSLVTKIGLKKVGLILDLMRFDDNILSVAQNNNNNPNTSASNLSNKSSSQHHWFLAYCCTSEIFRGNGIGSHMIENVLNWADHNGVETRTVVFENNSIEFFQHHGFEVGSEFKSNLPKGVSKVMVLVRKPKQTY
ncbi:hypothetical protein RB653_007043 [Dictyostelium firmibasis]|uniref:non-specific serine/threonine protein kinase n=1 Tax=Dictyostelium firmibasis TaxID=79012 RepID=A0AAN7TUT7_9MYCE